MNSLAKDSSKVYFAIIYRKKAQSDDFKAVINMPKSNDHMEILEYEYDLNAEKSIVQLAEEKEYLYVFFVGEYDSSALNAASNITNKIKSINATAFVGSISLVSDFFDAEKAKAMYALFDHTVFVDESYGFLVPINIIASVFGYSYIGVDFIAIDEALKKTKTSFLSQASCTEEDQIKEFIVCFVSLTKHFFEEQNINTCEGLIHISLSPQLYKKDSPLQITELIVDTIKEHEEKNTAISDIVFGVCNSNQEVALELSIWSFC